MNVRVANRLMVTALGVAALFTGHNLGWGYFFVVGVLLVAGVFI